MQYLLNCECGRTLEVTASQAGQQRKCECGQSIPVPTLRELRNLPTADPDPNLSYPNSQKRQSWSTGRGAVFVLGVLLSIVASGFLGKFFLDSKRLDVEKPSMSIFENQPKADQLTPAGTWQLWMEARSMKLEDRPMPRYLFHRQVARHLQGLTLVVGGVLALGLVMIIGSLTVGRRG